MLAGAVVIHLVYKTAQAMAYSRGAFTVVYPVVRGTGPLVTATAAAIVFGERYGLVQWLGILLLSGGILAFAALNLSETRVGRQTLRAALGYALFTGVMVAAYTTYDAWGIRLTPNPSPSSPGSSPSTGSSFPGSPAPGGQRCQRPRPSARSSPGA